MKARKNLILSVLLFFFGLQMVSGQSIMSRMPLKILYVGSDPLRPNPIPEAASGWPKRNHDLEPTRMPDFKQFLGQYFKTVKLMDAKDYKPSLSNDYDVTIFDAMPPAIVPEKKILDDKGHVKKIIYAKYLPENFSKPAIFISGNGGMVFTIGVKFVPECVCLGADAYNINVKHDIFKTPLPVALTMTKKNAPTVARLFSKNLPEQIPMWRVQKESVYEGTNYPPGVVYFHLGLDEPDAEFISGGVSAKDEHAAAIARHGNFLMWGFNAIPSDMTDEAKKVFVNAICYIKKFDGQKPVVRISTDPFPQERAGIEMASDLASTQGFERYKAMWEESSKPQIEKRKALAAKKASGSVLTETEETLLKTPAYPPIEWNSYFQQRYEYTRSIAGADSMAVQKDTLSILSYIQNNLKYFNGTIGSGCIDVDAKSLGIANNDLHLLETCVDMLMRNKDSEKAFRLLKRYTKENFNTALDWNNWLVKNKNRLFFTEAGGYKFIIAPADWISSGTKQDSQNISDAGIQKALLGIDCGTPDRLNPVLLGATVIDDSTEGKKLLLLKIRLLKNWHIYSYVPKDSPFIQSKLSLQLPPGVKQVGSVQSSAAKPMPGAPEVMIYEDEASFVQELTIEHKSLKNPKATISLYYQTCDANQCLPPDTLTKEIQL